MNPGGLLRRASTRVGDIADEHEHLALITIERDAVISIERDGQHATSFSSNEPCQPRVRNPVASTLVAEGHRTNHTQTAVPNCLLRRYLGGSIQSAMRTDT